MRTDPGFGPQSATRYSLRREAGVYRALGPTPMLVAELVAVHPDLPAFLLQRVRGESRFAQIADTATQESIARQFVDQLATLHRLDASTLDLPELGAPGALLGHVLDEIAEWEQQYTAAGGGVPVISLACVWLRANVPAADGWPVVLVQGDTGPGNFMFDDDRLVAVTDWELAHWGDVHDDLAWVLVRDTLERFPDLEVRFADYERVSGFTIEPARLRYFRVLAQWRSTIGTLAGLRSRDARGEMGMVVDTFRFYAGAPERTLGDTIPVAGGVAMTFREPVGVVALITPWNFPLTIASWKLAPAMAAGNTVVLKPAELTPLTAIEFERIAVEAGIPDPTSYASTAHLR